MKTKLCVLVFLLAAVFAQAQTTNLTGLLQAGLFEEQANRNLDAAIADYAALATQFDKDRQLAATAVFRLGECYRAQGKTNEAAAQYQRILRDFSDQTTLAMLSRQDLVGLGIVAPKVPQSVSENALSNLEIKYQLAKIQLQQARSASDFHITARILDDEGLNKITEEVDTFERTNQFSGEFKQKKTQEQFDRLNAYQKNLYAERERDLATLEKEIQQARTSQPAQTSVAGSTTSENSDAQLWNKLKDMPREELEKILPTLVPDSIFISLLQRRNEAEATLTQMQVNYGPEHSEVLKQKAYLDVIKKQLSARTDGILAGLKVRAEISPSPQVSKKAELLDLSPSIKSEEDKEITRIQQMIQNSPDLINARGEGGVTPLAQAAGKGSLKVAVFLIEHGADVNGSYALSAAVNSGNRAMVELLLNRGANVGEIDNSYGRTLLQKAVQKGYQSVAEVLLANKAEVNQPDNSGRTALYYALPNDHAKTAKMLLAAGADVNVENEKGRTPLSHAIESGSQDLIKLLLAAKADPNGGKVDAPLLAATYKKDIVSAELLLQAGADSNAKGVVDFSSSTFSGGNTRYSTTPLALAVSSGQLPMVQLLLKYKADPNDSVTEGKPLLFSALADTNILEALLAAGAKVEARDRSVAYNNVNIDRPLLVAALLDDAVANKNGAVEVLLNHGADVNAADGEGFTPLHTAAGHLVDRKVFERLLAAKADPNLRNHDGKTPLDLLAENSTQNIPGGGIPGPGLQMRGSTFQTRLQNIINQSGSAGPAKVKPAGELAELLRQHGALDDLPNWDRIAVSRPAANYSAEIFRKSTNDWNHYTLAELIYRAAGSHNQQIPFPDLTHLVIARPDVNGATAKRIEVNLLNATNGVDFEKDSALEFGDVVEIPERGHTLAEQDSQLNSQYNELRRHFSEKAGAVSLVVAGGQTVQVALKNFDCLEAYLGAVLRSSEAQNVLTSSSDLSRVKVTRRDLKTKKVNEWIVDCSEHQRSISRNGTVMLNGLSSGTLTFANGNNTQASSDLLLRDGDVIEVPEKR